MADALEVSLDFLVGKTELELDSSTINRIQAGQTLRAGKAAGVYGTGCTYTGF